MRYSKHFSRRRSYDHDLKFYRIFHIFLVYKPYLTNSVTIRIELSEKSRHVPINFTIFLC
jgi:hypothetical protein